MIEIDKRQLSPKEELEFPKVGDLVEWVNIMEVWASDKWVDEGGPYFDIAKWEDSMVRLGIVIEESIVEGIFHWTIWSWQLNKTFHASSTSDKIRIISRSPR
jgi:hypothetical protein